MKMLYEARIADLGSGDFVRVECASCGHEELIPAIGLQQGLRLPPDTLVLDLKRRMRCRECDAKGKAVVSIRWGASN
jgi:rubredoxin